MPSAAGPGDSSFFSDHTTIAAAAATGCLLIAPRWGLIAAGATVLVALGRVAIGAHYPSDVAVALLVGAGAVAALLPLRSRSQRLIGRLLETDQPTSVPRRHELRLGVVALVLLADDRITAWGIVRHDGLHNWWELHPLIGWTKGQLTAPATGGLDD
jgi:hypothetical protein